MRTNHILATAVSQILFLAIANSSAPLTERDYVERINREDFGGMAQVEVRTPDGSRCDLVTADHAIEVDMASKWAEAIGQSLYYGIALNRHPVIYLVVKKAADRKYYLRCLAVCAKHGITLKVHKTETQR